MWFSFSGFDLCPSLLAISCPGLLYAVCTVPLYSHAIILFLIPFPLPYMIKKGFVMVGQPLLYVSVFSRDVAELLCAHLCSVDHQLTHLM